MNRTSIRLIPALTLALTLSFVSTASAEVDPFPGVATGAEIPGTRLWSQPGVSQSTYEASPEYLAWVATGCPAGSGNGIGVDMNFTETRSDDRYFNQCIKTWRPQSEIDADAAFEQARRDATAAAEAQSLAWNQAHPGQQKCFQWGPIVHANGVSTASGGVCANPVPVPSGYVSETSTALVETTTPVETVTPVVVQTAPTPVVAVQEVITNRFGGYAVVHPGDGHVCGVVVSGSSDPFNNGGYMSNEYMGCPAGSRFIFQTTPSESGNVAGWHGSNVTWDGSKFIITNGSSIMTIANGIATDPNGRTWDTGTGRTITPGTVTPPPVVDSSTPVSDTSTPLVETMTVLTYAGATTSETTAGASEPIAIATTVALVDTSTVIAPTPADDLDSLPEVLAEEEISNSVIGTIVGVKTRIAVSSAWASTNMRVVASKKGFKKKYTYRFTTNSEGDYIFKSGVNLKGYTVILYKGNEELDRDYIS